MKPHPQALEIITKAFERRGFANATERAKAIASAIALDAIAVSPIGAIQVKNPLALAKLGADFSQKLPVEVAEENQRMSDLLIHGTNGAPPKYEPPAREESDIEARYREQFGMSIEEALK